MESVPQFGTENGALCSRMSILALIRCQFLQKKRVSVQQNLQILSPGRMKCIENIKILITLHIKVIKISSRETGSGHKSGL